MLGKAYEVGAARVSGTKAVLAHAIHDAILLLYSTLVFFVVLSRVVKLFSSSFLLVREYTGSGG